LTAVIRWLKAQGYRFALMGEVAETRRAAAALAPRPLPAG
jgi:hypothetical protein